MLNIPVPKRKVPAYKKVDQEPRIKPLVKKKAWRKKVIENTHTTYAMGNV